ncbi:MAG: T9SS type A sorting domain-containing protein, partial [Flavobacteriales bacterium]
PGVYNYHCDGDGHSATQFGTITVVDASTGLAALSDAGDGLNVYPSPANDKVCVDAGSRALNSIRVITLQGEEVLVSFPARSTKAIMDVSGLASGNYYLLITDAEGRLATKPFVKQ